MPYRKAADVKITNRVEFTEAELKEIICTQLEQHPEFSNSGVDPDGMTLVSSYDETTQGYMVVVTWRTESELV